MSYIDPRGLDNPGMGSYGPYWPSTPSPGFNPTLDYPTIQNAGVGGPANHPGPGNSNPPYNPQPNHCATAECAAGVLPAPMDLRTQSQIDVGQCKLVCQMAATLPVAACNKALGGNIITGLVGGGAVKKGMCSHICD